MWIWRGMYVTYIKKSCVLDVIYPLTPNDPYMGRTAPLTSKRCILYIYSTNVGTEYFKHALYSPLFSLQNAVCFIMLTCLVPVLFTFYIQGVLKLKKNNSGAKGLIRSVTLHNRNTTSSTATQQVQPQHNKFNRNTISSTATQQVQPQHNKICAVVYRYTTA